MRFLSPGILLAAVLFAQEPKQPERIVTHNIVTSVANPALRIEVPAEARYVGSDRWNLYGVADCELHVWIEAGQDRIVNRLYWIQFEAFLPDKPESRYKYPFARVKEIDGLIFDVRTRFGSDTPPRPDSDSGHVRKLIERAGYTMPRDMMSVRFVHLPDEQKRSEIMIIYAEDLRPAGLTASDLAPEGPASHRWARLEQDLIERGAGKLKLSR